MDRPFQIDRGDPASGSVSVAGVAAQVSGAHPGAQALGQFFTLHARHRKKITTPTSGASNALTGPWAAKFIGRSQKWQISENHWALLPSPTYPELPEYLSQTPGRVLASTLVTSGAPESEQGLELEVFLLNLRKEEVP